MNWKVLFGVVAAFVSLSVGLTYCAFSNMGDPVQSVSSR